MLGVVFAVPHLFAFASVYLSMLAEGEGANSKSRVKWHSMDGCLLCYKVL